MSAAVITTLTITDADGDAVTFEVDHNAEVIRVSVNNGMHAVLEPEDIATLVDFIEEETVAE